MDRGSGQFVDGSIKNLRQRRRRQRPAAGLDRKKP